MWKLIISCETLKTDLLNIYEENLVNRKEKDKNLYTIE